MLDPVIWIYVAVVAIAAVAAVVISDVLEHRKLPTWPLGLVAVAGFVLAGLTYSSWFAAAALGIGCGVLIVSARGFVQLMVGRHRRSVGRAARAGRSGDHPDLGDSRRNS